MNRIIVFTSSVFFCVLFLSIERFVGIKWNYHPDSETYVLESPSIAINLIENGFLGFFNNFYYLISFIFSYNISYLISLNIVIYSFTNLIIFNFLSNYQKKHLGILAFWLLALIPYRLHLAVHILKDTLIIFFLVSIISKSFFSRFSYFFILLMRIFSVFYFFILVPVKYYKILIPLFFLFFIFWNEELITFLTEKNEVNMTFREFDKVPTFSEFGLIGIFIRAFIWPLLVITGFYFFISPSFAFFPVALGSFIIQLWCRFYLKSFGFFIQIYASCFLIALFVNGFTSYLRYTFPLILIIPLFQIRLLQLKETTT